MKNLSQAGIASGAAALSFVNWTDPREGAFSVSVPQGWRAIGGTYRLSPTDVRYAIAMGSPDGQLRASIGDASIGLFIPPSQMLAMAGLREGGTYGLGDGTKAEIRRYIPGPQFARSYAQIFVGRQCSGLQVQSNNIRQDLASSFIQSARNEGLGSRPYITAGDVSFTCNLNGAWVQGKYVAGTFPFVPNQTSMWGVYRLCGYLAAASRGKRLNKSSRKRFEAGNLIRAGKAQQQGIRQLSCATGQCALPTDSQQGDASHCRGSAADVRNNHEGMGAAPEGI